MTNGQYGEQLAARYAQQRGWHVLARNFRIRNGEIDLICTDAHNLMFIEVKTRSSSRFGAPREAVTLTKQRHLIHTARHWLMRHPTTLQPRFDVIEVYLHPDGSFRIVHLPHAFEVTE